jgi:FHA domain
MPELWLKFTDEKGEARRVLAAKERFAVGRHSSNDLSVPSGKLSREHLKIERFGDVFVASDSDSRNGTTVNGENLDEPVSLKNGDVLNLGGGLEIEIELISGGDEDAAGENGAKDDGEGTENASGVSAASKSVSASTSDGSIPTKFLLLAPALGLLVLLFAAGIFFIFSGKGEPEIVENGGNFIYSNGGNGRTNKNENKNTTEKSPTPSPANSFGNTAETPTPAPVSDEIEKIKQNSAEFMRRIAKNDASPFLTGDQAEQVGAKIKSLKNSAALIENLRAVKKDAAEFESMASSKDLKPQFLAAAALTKIGDGRNPTAAARSMLPVLNELKIALDNNLANDNLLIIASYERGAAGKPRDLRNVIEALAKKTQSLSPREIRSIWFLRKNGKISDAEFESAVRFLAIGAIMQNPKDFGINTEAVIF